MMDREPDECELARRARDGDRSALSDLVERVRRRLFALALAELHHYQDAQDAVAAALLRICRHIGELREPENVRAWMSIIVRNEARTRLKRRAWEPVSLEEWRPPSGDDAPASSLRLDIELALRRLPREQATAIALFYLGRVPLRDIARLTGRPEGTIKRWLHLGRRALAKEMEAYAPMSTRGTKPAAQSRPGATPVPRPAHCFICGKSRTQVPKLMIGLHGAICYECVDLCAGIVADWPAEPRAMQTSASAEPRP